LKGNLGFDTGQFMIVCASEFRQLQGERLVRSLARLVPHWQPEAKLFTWHAGDIEPSFLADFRLMGLKVGGSAPWEHQLPFSAHLTRFVASLDLDQRLLQCVPYEGGCLDELTDSKRLKLHTSDESFVDAIKGRGVSSVIT